MNMFKQLDAEEKDEYRQWARDNYTAGQEVKRGIWHPVVVEECDLINEETEE